jgi:hypothetical protein
MKDSSRMKFGIIRRVLTGNRLKCRTVKGTGSGGFSLQSSYS